MFCGLNNSIYTRVRQKDAPFVNDCRQCYRVYVHETFFLDYFIDVGKFQAQKLQLPKLTVLVVQ